MRFQLKGGQKMIYRIRWYLVASLFGLQINLAYAALDCSTLDIKNTKDSTRVAVSGGAKTIMKVAEAGGKVESVIEREAKKINDTLESANTIAFKAAQLMFACELVKDDSKNISQEMKDRILMKVFEIEFNKPSTTVKQIAPTKPAVKAATDEWLTWNFDLFWCEGSGQLGKANAEAEKDTLLSKGATGRIRVRLLEKSIYSDQDTGLSPYSDYEIRPNEGEYEIAEKLRSALTAKLGLKYEYVESSTPTPKYISIFNCPNIAKR